MVSTVLYLTYMVIANGLNCTTITYLVVAERVR